MFAMVVSPALAQSRVIKIATVNNPEMLVLQELSKQFEEQNPDIQLDWQLFSENELRSYLARSYLRQVGRASEPAPGAGLPPEVEQFDIVTLGNYDIPIWVNWGWLVPLKVLPASYDVKDLLPRVRKGLSQGGVLYGLPFYGESSMTYYRTDLFQKAGLTMPDNPSYEDIAQFAKAVHDPDKEVYGICLRGKAGWGENMAYVSTLVNTFGGGWFDEHWNTTIDSPAWKEAVAFYIDLLHNYGPPHATRNGYKENLALFAQGHCGIWVDATVAAGFLSDNAKSKVSGNLGFAAAPIAKTPKGSHWLWSWNLAISASAEAPEEALRFLVWATSKDYIDRVAQQDGWAAVPPGTRQSTYSNPDYLKAAPFAGAVLDAMQSADPNDSTLQPTPYSGIQFVAIPEFQYIGTQVGQFISAALAGKLSVDSALAAAQNATSQTMRWAGYTTGYPQ
ncbi:sugar ABC transporter substrate-binding protein [Thiorhodococcus mannitoliphagus]|uniref:Sugar ABC transporter substrate-binding protein n=2 Tax=Thiorhodococcus mannitoliphagus TaxID=329406 RepID=A0A6P1DT30_9GAMM|nr:sugar ABC transporter substrate-binding protein [Thiorhodococcus mannitoliphagus]